MGKEKQEMRKVFDVYLNKRPTPVYNIPGREHLGLNGEPNTWWVWTGEKGKIPEPASDSFVPYSVGIKRPAWVIKIDQNNYTKHKWGETDFRNAVRVEMFADGKLVYGFTTSSVDFALAKVGYLKVVLIEHPYDFFNTAKEDGRKIWWRGLPALIRTSRVYPWEVKIYPDYEMFSDKQWWKALREREANMPAPGVLSVDNDMMGDAGEDQRQGYINWGDALSDQYINWFRK